jgi:hypothetical protein
MDGKVLKVPGPWQEFVKPQFLVPEKPGSMMLYEALVGMGDEEGNLMVRYAGGSTSNYLGFPSGSSDLKHSGPR